MGDRAIVYGSSKVVEIDNAVRGPVTVDDHIDVEILKPYGIFRFPDDPHDVDVPLSFPAPWLVHEFCGFMEENKMPYHAICLRVVAIEVRNGIRSKSGVFTETGDDDHGTEL